MSPERALARLGYDYADRLEQGGASSSSGLVWRLSSVVEAQAAELERLRRAPPESACPRCGEQVVQSGRGRPATYCSTKCRKAHHDETRRNGRMVA